MAGGKKKATGFTQAEQELLAVSEKNHERFFKKSGELFKGYIFVIFTEIGDFSEFFLVKFLKKSDENSDKKF